MKRRSLEKMIWSKVAARLGQSLAPLKEQHRKTSKAEVGRTCAALGGQGRQQSCLKMRLTKGFGDKALKQGQEIQNRVMAEVGGFKDVHFSNNIPIIALAD